MDAVSHRNEEPGESHELPKPESCYAAGLECRSCVRNSAVNLAQICLNLSIEAVRDSFFKIYPDQACLPMGRTFIRTYRATQAASGDSAGEPLSDFSLLTVVPILLPG